MFLVGREDYSKLLIFDTDDGTLEVVREDDFCRYLIGTGVVHSIDGGKLSCHNNSLVCDITLFRNDTGYHISSITPENGFFYMDSTSFLVRIFNRVYVRGIGMQGSVTLHFRGMCGKSPYLLWDNLNDFNINIKVDIYTGDSTISVPVLERAGQLSSDETELYNELQRTHNIGLFYRFLDSDIQKKLLMGC